ncbi:MAG: hypothetical protein ACLPSW_20315 [Roseiarcus sp.]
MAKAWEGAARAAEGFAAGRRRRGELAMEIKATTKSRRGEVRSLLANLKGARGRASREQAAEMKKATRARRGDVRSMLEGLEASRRRAIREYHKEAKAANSARKAEVGALLTRFFNRRVARRRDRQKLATTLRKKAAAFMRDLTGGVAALRDGFAKEGRDRAAGIRGRLLAYSLERRKANAMWRETPSRARGAGAEPREAGARPAAAETVAVSPEPPAAPMSAAETRETIAAPSSDPAVRSGRQVPAPLGHRGSAGHHGRGSK